MLFLPVHSSHGLQPFAGPKADQASNSKLLLCLFVCMQRQEVVSPPVRDSVDSLRNEALVSFHHVLKMHAMKYPPIR